METQHINALQEFMEGSWLQPAFIFYSYLLLDAGKDWSFSQHALGEGQNRRVVCDDTQTHLLLFTHVLVHTSSAGCACLKEEAEFTRRNDICRTTWSRASSEAPRQRPDRTWH